MSAELVVLEGQLRARPEQRGLLSPPPVLLFVGGDDDEVTTSFNGMPRGLVPPEVVARGTLGRVALLLHRVPIAGGLLGLHAPVAFCDALPPLLVGQRACHASGQQALCLLYT